MSIPPISSMDPSEQRSPMQTGGPDDSAWTGWIAFAGVVMVMLGIFHAIQGLVALFKDDYYAVHSSGLVVSVNYTTWGWVHLLGGIILVAAGAAVFTGQIWARTIGVILALVSAVVKRNSAVVTGNLSEANIPPTTISPLPIATRVMMT